jgi:hypothetical protein
LYDLNDLFAKSQAAKFPRRTIPSNGVDFYKDDLNIQPVPPLRVVTRMQFNFQRKFVLQNDFSEGLMR